MDSLVTDYKEGSFTLKYKGKLSHFAFLPFQKSLHDLTKISWDITLKQADITEHSLRDIKIKTKQDKITYFEKTTAFKTIKKKFPEAKIIDVTIKGKPL